MDDDSMLSEEDYAAHITSQNNMDEDVVHSSPPSNVPSFGFVLPPSQTPCVSNEENPGLTPTIDTITSTEPSPSMVIPYSTNVLADPTLWDGNFTATSLFSTNEFLNSDINNISCSLQRMACFLRQCNLEGHNRNNIKQLDPFGQSAWDFISTIFESGWDILTTANKSTIRGNIAKEFGKATNPSSRENICHGTHISKVPPLSYPALPRKSWKSQRHSNKASLPKVTPTYHTLRLRHTLQMLLRSKKPSLLYQTRKFSKCTMQLLHNLSTKPRKSNTLLKDLLENRPSS